MIFEENGREGEVIAERRNNKIKAPRVCIHNTARGGKNSSSKMSVNHD
jgi:hypothetical protein